MTDPKLFTYTGYTLVDITDTGVVKYTPEEEYARNQQRNWETVVQILGLRTQILRLEPTTSAKENLKNFAFGTAYQGKQRVWQFEFDIEYADLYTVGKDPYKLLKDDFAQVPIITGLDETCRPALQLFYTQGEAKNIYFKLLK